MTPANNESIVVQKGLGSFAPEIEALRKGKVDATQATAVRIPIELIDEPTAMGSLPLDKAKVAQLAASIEHDGLLNPIDVKTKGTRYELIAGRHRTYAHKALKLSEIPAFIRDDVSDGGAIVLATVENLVRRKLPPYEEARNYAAILMHNEGMTQEQLAKRVGVSVDLVKGRLQLLKLPVEIGQRIGRDHVTLQHADVLLALQPYPKLYDVAVKFLDKKDHDKQPLDAGAYWFNVERELQQKRLLTSLRGYPWYQVAGEKSFKEAVEKLPKLRVDGEDLVVDEKGVLEKAHQVALAAQQRREEDKIEKMRGKVKEGKASKEDLQRLKREQERRLDETVVRVTQLRTRDVLAKAAHTLSGQEDPRLATLFLQLVGAECSYDQDFADRVHAHVGAPLELILEGASHLRHGDGEDRAAILLKLYRKDPKIGLQAGVAIALRHLHESGDNWSLEREDQVLQQWARVKEADLEKKVRAQLKEQAKEGKKRVPWQETPRAVKCPTCGAAEKQDCRGPTTHVIKEPHAARVDAWSAARDKEAMAKATGKKPAPKGKGRKPAKARKKAAEEVGGEDVELDDPFVDPEGGEDA